MVNTDILVKKGKAPKYGMDLLKNVKKLLSDKDIIKKLSDKSGLKISGIEVLHHGSYDRKTSIHISYGNTPPSDIDTYALLNGYQCSLYSFIRSKESYKKFINKWPKEMSKCIDVPTNNNFKTTSILKFITFKKLVYSYLQSRLLNCKLSNSNKVIKIEYKNFIIEIAFCVEFKMVFKNNYNI